MYLAVSDNNTNIVPRMSIACQKPYTNGNFLPGYFFALSIFSSNSKSMEAVAHVRSYLQIVSEMCNLASPPARFETCYFHTELVVLLL